MGTLCSSAETPDATASDFRLLFYKVFARKEARIYFNEETTNMKTDDLETIARKLVAPGKGILAADESSGTIEKRLKSINVPSNEENRRMYREILFTTNGAGEFISGVILFDETIRQKSRDGRSFVEVLDQQGIVPGIKVDKGAKAMANFPSEKITEGLDGLRERLTEYRKLGARFAKWRAVITIGDGIPTRTCIDSNAEALARYAALCQEGDLVPIVEPEVLMDGTHTIERDFEVTEQTLRSDFDSLAEHRVVLEGILLKPNMVLSGKENPKQVFFFSSRRRHTRFDCDWSSDVCSSDLCSNSTASSSSIGRSAASSSNTVWCSRILPARRSALPTISPTSCRAVLGTIAPDSS